MSRAHESKSKPNLLKQAISQARREFLGTVVRVETSEAVAALTFDDGPDPEYTPRLLEVLERHGAKGTFFMLGRRAVDNLDLVVRIAAGGHVIGNHTYDHVKMPQTPRVERLRQLVRSKRVLGSHAAPLFRPPYGGQTLGSRIDAMLLGYDVIGWDYHVEDWAGHSAEIMAERLEQRLRPGSIILLHDSLYKPRVASAADRSPMIAALDSFLSRVGDTYRFVTVPELMRHGRPVRIHWVRPAL